MDVPQTYSYLRVFIWPPRRVGRELLYFFASIALLPLNCLPCRDPPHLIDMAPAFLQSLSPLIDLASYHLIIYGTLLGTELYQVSISSMQIKSKLR